MYVVVQRAVYRHDIVGAYPTLERAMDAAEMRAKAEGDDWHRFEVIYCPYDKVLLPEVSAGKEGTHTCHRRLASEEVSDKEEKRTHVEYYGKEVRVGVLSREDRRSQQGSSSTVRSLYRWTVKYHRRSDPLYEVSPRRLLDDPPEHAEDRRDPLVELAYRILAEDPIACDIARDVLMRG